jgi:flagellar biosynthesis protein FliR
VDGGAVNITVGNDIALAFGLLFARAAGVMMALPQLLGVSVPMKVRAALAMLLAAALMPLASLTPPPAGGILAIALLVIRELAIGAAISFAAAIVVGAVVAVGDVLGASMELNSGAVLRGDVQAPNILADSLGVLTGLLFFIGGFHRALILALGRSLAVMPLGTFAMPNLHSIIALSGRMFELALDLGLPVIVPMFILSLSQGVIARLAPQLNVLVAAPAAMILAGLTILGLDALGFGAGITRTWEFVISQSNGWLHLNG